MNKAHLTSIVLAASLGASGVALWSCSIERPGVGSKDYEKPRFLHEGHTLSCGGCHEDDRPGPDDDGAEHGGGKDCKACHQASDNNAGWLPAQIFTHNPLPQTCLPCHAKQRPAPPHVPDGDCAKCHQWPSWVPF